MLSVRVHNLRPSVNVLHYPDHTLSLLDRNITIGKGSDGLCGGMVFTVRTITSGQPANALWKWMTSSTACAGKARKCYLRIITAALFVLGGASWVAAQGVGNACAPGGTCDITNPVYVNVYWDSSKSQWDQDEISADQGDMLAARIDALTEAITHSNYFAGLSAYSVRSATFLRSVAGDCAPLPSTIQPPNNYANKQMQELANCVLAANPDLNPSTTILNVFLPPQVVPTSATADYCNKYLADHDQFWSPVGITRIPTHPTCNSNIGSLFISLTHEMVEAAVDPVPASPTGWKVFGGGVCDEIADLCSCPGKRVAPSPAFLYGLVAPYWINGMNTCFTPSLLSVPPGSTPTIAVSNISGSGKSTTFSLSGSSLADANVGAPWDLKIGRFGGQTLYLQAMISHPGQATWSAGNIEGTPPDKVGFGPITWSDNGNIVNITVNGFIGDYGNTINEIVGIASLTRTSNQVTVTTTTPNTLVSGATVEVTGANPSDLNGIFQVTVQDSMTFMYPQKGQDANGTGGTVATSPVAVIAPGDTVTFSYSDPSTGLSTTAKGITPFPAKISATLDESRPKHPTVQESETFTGVVLDAQGHGMESATVSCTSCQPFVAARTGSSGAFILSSVVPSPIAGPQTVILRTRGTPPTQVTASLTNDVFPVVTSIEPAIGPVAGNISATLHGGGFDRTQAATIINFTPSSILCLPRNRCPGKPVNPRSVTADYKSATLTVPPSPLRGDGSGSVYVSATVNKVQSATLEYLYVVPGKPVLDFTPKLCGGGYIIPNVYGSDGSPTQIPVMLNASYYAFLPTGGTAAQSVTVPSGQAVSFSGAGPVTATNTLTSQSVMQSFPVPQINPCTAGNLLWPKLQGVVLWNPGLWIHHLGPGCGDCPANISHSVVWMAESNTIGAGGFVSIAGSNPTQILSNFGVRTVGGQEFMSYFTQGTLAVIQGPNNLTVPSARAISPGLQFLGPAIALDLRNYRGHKAKHINEIFTVIFRLPKDASRPQDYRILHLVRDGSTPTWREDIPTKVAGHDGSVAIVTKELGIYALAQSPTADISSQQISDSPHRPR